VKPADTYSKKESVWDYPRPPRLELTGRLLRVEFAGEIIAQTRLAYRVLETSHPPTYYIPPADIQRHFLSASNHRTFCEFKGQAYYWTLIVGERRSENAGWYYPNPTASFIPIRDYIAFYPSRVDACHVDNQKVTPQDGDFYGGWITPDIIGPFKGKAGTAGW
jgi:uncharacterized protein (DUF427 family)